MGWWQLSSDTPYSVPTSQLYHVVLQLFWTTSSRMRILSSSQRGHRKWKGPNRLASKTSRTTNFGEVDQRSLIPDENGKNCIWKTQTCEEICGCVARAQTSTELLAVDCFHLCCSSIRPVVIAVCVRRHAKTAPTWFLCLALPGVHH